MTSPLEAALVVALMVLPFHLLLQRELARLSDPRHLRERGVTVLSERVIEPRGAVLGTYRGRPIHAELRFMGMMYRFECIVPPAYRDQVGPRQLFLEPGLLYLTD